MTAPRLIADYDGVTVEVARVANVRAVPEFVKHPSKVRLVGCPRPLRRLPGSAWAPEEPSE